MSDGRLQQAFDDLFRARSSPGASYQGGLYASIDLGLVNEAVREGLRDDAEDLAAFEERVNEPTITYEALLAELKSDGKL